MAFNLIPRSPCSLLKFHEQSLLSAFLLVVYFPECPWKRPILPCIQHCRASLALSSEPVHILSSNQRPRNHMVRFITGCQSSAFCQGRQKGPLRKDLFALMVWEDSVHRGREDLVGGGNTWLGLVTSQKTNLSWLSLFSFSSGPQPWDIHTVPPLLSKPLWK